MDSGKTHYFNAGEGSSRKVGFQVGRHYHVPGKDAYSVECTEQDGEISDGKPPAEPLRAGAAGAVLHKLSQPGFFDTGAKTMNAKAANSQLADTVQHELARFRKEWWFFLLLGITLLICGIVAVTFPFVTTVGVIIVLGAALIVGGVSLVINSFWAGKWSGFFLQLLVGIFYSVAGFTLIDAPIRSIVMLTLLLAAFFIVIGLIRIITALVERYALWGWSLLNGVVTLLLGVIIYRNCKPGQVAEAVAEGDLAALADKWLWVIGLLIGVDLILNGWNWVMLALNIKNLPESDG